MDKEKEITETVTERDTSEKNTTETKEDSIRRDYGFAPDVELKECRYCRVMIPKKARVCPNCRMSLKKYWFRNLVAAVFAVAVIGVGGYYLSDHWGIMRDAVMSVWIAQDNNAVSTVSVTTVDTAEMAAGAAQAGSSEVAVNKENSENTDAEEATKSGTEAARDNIAETEKEADSPETSADTSGQAQNKTTGSKQSVSNMASSKEDNTADIDELTADKDEGEKAAENRATEDEETTSDSGTAEKKNAAGNSTNTVNGDKDNNGKDDSDKDNNDKEKSNINSNGKEKSDNNKDDKGNNSNDEDNNSKIEGYDEESQQASGEKTAAGNDSTQQEQAFRDDCSEVSYKALLRDSETYLNTALKVEVQVVCQVMGGLFDDNIYYLCKVEGVSGIERYYIIRDDREEDDTLILEGDTLTVYGELFGNCKLPANLIETRPTVPAVAMLYFDLKEE